MLECFDGMYWDCLHLEARYDPVVGNAWTDEKGRTHPGLGIFDMRELIKRTAVMFAGESKKFPPNRLPLITQGHMTNTCFIPVLAFANSTLDWEWKYGLDDFQDRFTWGLTMAEAVGRQVGAWPTVLGGGYYRGDNAKVQRTLRTRLGVCLVHEIAIECQHSRGYGRDLYAKLFKFGYGLPECKVYNYWQEDNPVAVISKTTIKILVVSKKNQCLVVVTDYGNGGHCNVKLDLKKLGLDDKATAVNFETGKPVKRIGAGEFEINVPKHDFRIIIVKNTL